MQMRRRAAHASSKETHSMQRQHETQPLWSNTDHSAIYYYYSTGKFREDGYSKYFYTSFLHYALYANIYLYTYYYIFDVVSSVVLVLLYCCTNNPLGRINDSIHWKSSPCSVCISPTGSTQQDTGAISVQFCKLSLKKWFIKVAGFLHGGIMMSSLTKRKSSSMQPLSEPDMLSAWLTVSPTSVDPTPSTSQRQNRPRWPQSPYLWLEGRKAAWAASLQLNVTSPSPSHPGSHGGLLHLHRYSCPHPILLLLPLCSRNSFVRFSVSFSPPSLSFLFAFIHLQAASCHLPLRLYTHFWNYASETTHVNM